MYRINNLFNNDDIHIIEKKGNVTAYEYLKDLSVTPTTSMQSYFNKEMGVTRKQVLIELNKSSFVLSAGAMQWIVGDVKTVTDIKGVGDFFGKAIKGTVTKEAAVKPKYTGTGAIILEPTYRHIILENVAEWGQGMVLDDGLFLACDATIKQDVVARTNLSSAVLGNQGLWSLKLSGEGIAVLESPVPREELIEINLENDTLKVDGNFAIAWSQTLDFRVEKSTKNLIGSAVSGEGFVNVYSGTGKVLLAPTINNSQFSVTDNPYGV